MPDVWRQGIPGKGTGGGAVSVPLVFGKVRLPEKERWCPAWPRHPRGSYVNDAAAWTRFVKDAQKQVDTRTA